MSFNFVRGLLAVPRAALLTAINTAIGTVGNDNILEIAWNVFRKATQKAILTTISVILKTIVSAMIGYLGPVDSIWKTIIDNPANEELFESLKNDWWKVAHFLVDILEPMKRFTSADSINGTPIPGADAWNNYNELDLTQPMNRHAVLSQVQRFFKSIIEVFRQKDLDVTRFDMNTRLETDSLKPTIKITALKRKDDSAKQPETWIFVNGIAGEFYWNHLSVQKLQDFFFDRDNPEDDSEDAASRRTAITGVFNRSDGILWDLIECAGERRPQLQRINTKDLPRSTTLSKSPLSARTASSREAQAQLSAVLRAALADSKTTGKDIIMIAHSQGCLLLRLAIEEISKDTQDDLAAVMRTHLRVSTFGNPAYDWDVHAHTASTEHFANELDYVAKLGVLRLFSSDPSEAVSNDLNYCSLCRAGDEKHLMLPKQLIFVNNQRQTGHLFGSQYSLQAKDYDCVNEASGSRLLARAERRG